MAEVVVLTDTVLWGKFGNGRYMGAYAVAAGCRAAGLDTTVIDYFTRIPDFFSYIEPFLSEQTQVIGFSSTFLSTLKDFDRSKYKQRSQLLTDFFSGELWQPSGDQLHAWLSEFKELVARRAPRAKLVLGGSKSQFALWRPEHYQLFDYIVLGPADRALPEFVWRLKRGEDIVTKTYRDVKIIDNSEDVNHKFCPEMIWTEREAVARGEAVPIEISRGCVFNCKFCHYNKKESFKKDLEVLRREMSRNYHEFGIDTYAFCDDCFNDHPNKVKSVCEMFLQLPFKIEWTAYARVDVAVKFPWTLELMIESGARGLYWGIESFDHEVARRAGKGTPPEQVKELLHRLHTEFSDRCLTEASFIAGLPGETDASLLLTEQWLIENPIIDVVTFGALGLVPYVASFDQKVFDFADYSRNPEKYGFKKVSFKPHYWEHETMNLPQAQEWAVRIGESYRAKRPRGLAASIWAYPHLKTLGYSKEQIFAMFRDPGTGAQFSEVADRFDRHLQSYWRKLAAVNTVDRQSVARAPVLAEVASL